MTSALSDLWPAPDIGENPTVVVCNELSYFAALPQFDIRNGDLSDARSLLIKPTIHRSYHWVPVAGSGPKDGIPNVEAHIKSHIEHLESNPPPNTDAAQRRKVGICLGVSRAVATSLFNLTSRDLVPGETADPKLVLVKNPDGTTTFVARPDLPAEAKARLAAPLDLTETEKSVVATLLMSSIGTIPLQGYSLMMTQHHYLSAAESQSRKAYATVERQFWKGTDVAQWFAADTALIQDAMWHKACHPVNMTLKTNAATSVKVATMVKEAGCGSAAARLPAVEPEVRAANSYRTLMATVSPMYKMCSGAVSYELLDVAMDVVKAFPYGVVNPTRPVGLDARVPPTVVDRATARAWLGSILSRNADKAAHCYGFYCALIDAAQTTNLGAGTESLKTSYSLHKLQSQSHAAYISGQQFYSDYQSARAALRAQGNIVAPVLDVD